MRILIDTDTETIRIQTADDLRRLDAVVSGAGDPAAILDGIGEIERNHLWMRIDALRTLAGEQPESWESRFDAMIAYAASKGWTDAAGKMVRVHLASPD